MVHQGASLTGGVKPESVDAKIVGAPHGGNTRSAEAAASRHSAAHFSNSTAARRCRLASPSVPSRRRAAGLEKELCRRSKPKKVSTVPPSAFKGSAMRATAFGQVYDWKEAIQLQASQGPVRVPPDPARNPAAG